MKLVLSNIGPDDADRVARALIDERRAACVNLTPVRSVYRWEGSVHVDPEVTMLIKVSLDGLDALVARLRELHPYDLPEIVVLDVDVERSLGAYVQWVRDETGRAEL
ncbi:MAG: divalent-cation tolerance protein CutA [Deltaproteobacteria bacterium]|nr:divalent-cation tolerance protein CutA [Deltaproteobacteria bacterium]